MLMWPWPGTTAKDDAKLKKFSSIFWENSAWELMVEACVFCGPVCWASCEIGSTEIPTRAVVCVNDARDSIIAWPKGFWLPTDGLMFVILKIADGLSLLMKPRNCHETPPSGDDKPKWMPPPNPSEKGTCPVRKTTIWFTFSTSSKVR